MSDEKDFYSLLARRSAEGAPLVAWIEDPAGLERAALHGGDAFSEAIEHAAHVANAQSALMREESVAAAVLSRSGQIIAADARFNDWFGPEIIDLPTVQTVLAKGLIEQKLHFDSDNRPTLFAYARCDAAANWLLPDSVRTALDDQRAAVVILGAAPARARQIQREVARAFGLLPVEAKVVAALVETGRLPDAAREVGISYSAARDAMAGALKRTGARRQADLVAKVLSLTVGAWRKPPEPSKLLVDAFGITTRQALIALKLTDGLTRAQVARALKVSEAVVKDDLTRVFGRLHVATASDLARITTETIALAALTSISFGEFSSPRDGIEPVRFIARPDDRGGGWIAISDYGPRSGDPVLVLHSGGTSRHVPRSFVKALQTKGFRPIAIDRPGFGLSTFVEGPDGRQRPFYHASEDMICVCTALELDKVRLLLRGNGRGAYEFCQRVPERVECIVALNPDPPHQFDTKRDGVLGIIKKAIISRPSAISTMARLIFGQTNMVLIERAIRSTLADSPTDLAIFDDPNEVIDYGRSVRLLAAGNIDGFIAEQTALIQPWDPEPLTNGPLWTFLLGQSDPLYHSSEGFAYWSKIVPGCHAILIPGGGRFVHLSHSDVVIDALRGRKS